MLWYTDEKVISGILNGKLSTSHQMHVLKDIRWFARVQHPLIKKIYTGKLYPEKVVDKIEELEVTNDPEARKILENLQYNELCSIAMTAIENKLYD